jgi:hypothetical protein
MNNKKEAKEHRTVAARPLPYAQLQASADEIYMKNRCDDLTSKRVTAERNIQGQAGKKRSKKCHEKMHAVRSYIMYNVLWLQRVDIG